MKFQFFLLERDKISCTIINRHFFANNVDALYSVVDTFKSMPNSFIRISIYYYFILDSTFLYHFSLCFLLLLNLLLLQTISMATLFSCHPCKSFHMVLICLIHIYFIQIDFYSSLFFLFYVLEASDWHFWLNSLGN